FAQRRAAVIHSDFAADSRNHPNESNPRSPTAGMGERLQKNRKSGRGSSPVGSLLLFGCRAINLYALLALFPLSLVFLETRTEARAILKPNSCRAPFYLPSGLNQIMLTTAPRSPSAGPWRTACGCSHPLRASQRRLCDGCLRWQ